MGRPRLIRRGEGLTRTEIAKQLKCSYSNVRRWHEEGLLPSHKDRDGNWRSTPSDVVDFARKVGRTVATDGETIARIYERFMEPCFKLTNESIARIVVETRQHPDLVVALWHKYNNAAPVAPTPAARDIDRISREYDEQIAAMDEQFARRRRASSFIAGDDHAPESTR